ncbi:hypothetical protein [Alistipes shahii]|uniref:hypothetical protein n=1 Tax=Alistipes putredinis TaxID=28117 RepID=UPI00266617AF|nr:hypothetical protein [Alistipes shahii]
MKTINLKEFDVFTDITKKQRVRCDVRKSVANMLYNQMHGIEALNLALMIYKSEGKLVVSDDDLRTLQLAFKQFGTPALIEALAAQIKELNTPTDKTE